jgi:glucans biosynthesis protein C
MNTCWKQCEEFTMHQADTVTSTHVAFLDNIRYLMVLLVLVYHSVAAYATVAPHWVIHDTSFFAADIIRELFDVFMMPMLFFVAGYFTVPSLEKKGVWKFLMDKFRRLLIPWALAVLVVLPLALYDQPVKPVRPFWNYWLHTFFNIFDTRLNFPQYGPHYQNVYWFISLLFTFFAVFALFHAVTLWWHRATVPKVIKVTHGNSVLIPLVLFGVLTSAGYFISLLLLPDASWFRLGMFLEFQVPRLVLFVGYFVFGVYTQSHRWFVDGKTPGSLALWGAVSAALVLAYLVFAQTLLASPSGTLLLPVWLLLSFAFIRSFLLLSLLVVFVSFGIRYWNHTSGVDRQFAATSYDIYLTHIWFLVAIQHTLMAWKGGPAQAKSAIVLFAGLALSYAFSRWVIGRFPRMFVAVILALFLFCLAVRP